MCMALECNIDAAGKAARLKAGILGVLGSAALGIGLATGLLSGTFWLVVTAGAFAGGAFTIFEARAGWCVVRAMGIPTRI